MCDLCITLAGLCQGSRSFNLKKAMPNMESHPYDWRVDKYEPQRVWFTVRNTATHTGPLTFAGFHLQAHWQGAVLYMFQRLLSCG